MERALDQTTKEMDNVKISLWILFLATAVLAIASGVASSQDSFLRAMHESMARMHAAMDRAPQTGDSDGDFALMMIPHHQGAIDMAKVELLYGKNPVMRRLAQEIIADQQSEIEVMRLYLSKNSGNERKGN
jgi:uncharacterized protein (DUF305 family)